MAQKQVQGRFTQKIDTTANWDKAVNFIPMLGEIIIYKDNDIVKEKIGDGVTTVGNLKFNTDNTLAYSGVAADAKAVSDAINAPKDYILLTDQVNGKKYRIYMSDGNLVSEREFDPTTDLVDFEYTDNGNGTYTLNSWKGTSKGEPSTEMIIPNNSAIIL